MPGTEIEHTINIDFGGYYEKNNFCSCSVTCLAGCITYTYVAPETKYSNVQKLVINGLSENDGVEMEIAMWYDRVGGDFRDNKSKNYTKDAEESFPKGIDICHIGILKPYSEPPLYEAEIVFENHILTFTVVKANN